MDGGAGWRYSILENTEIWHGQIANKNIGVISGIGKGVIGE